MFIREIEVEDAENYINLIKEVERHSDFMLMGAGERKTTPEQQQRQLERIKKQPNSTIFVAEDGGKLLGYLMAMGGTVEKNKHSAYLVIGILQDHRGQGIGTQLFEHVMEWAGHNDITRLELTAVTENKAGVALYIKNGFEIEGTKRNSLIIHGKYVDEYYMAKLL
jgi:RimJ/RimL family protein N-acetyltransferase